MIELAIVLKKNSFPKNISPMNKRIILRIRMAVAGSIGSESPTSLSRRIPIPVVPPIMILCGIMNAATKKARRALPTSMQSVVVSGFFILRINSFIVFLSLKDIVRTDILYPKFRQKSTDLQRYCSLFSHRSFFSGIYCFEVMIYEKREMGKTDCPCKEIFY